jgi:hypothetical protein
MLDSRYPQMRIHSDPEQIWLGAQGREEEAILRIGASNFLGGVTARDEALRQLLRQHGGEIRSLVALRQIVSGDDELHEFVVNLGFQDERALGRYVVLWRP